MFMSFTPLTVYFFVPLHSCEQMLFDQSFWYRTLFWDLWKRSSMTCFLFLSISRRCMVPIKGPKRWNNGMLLPVVLHASDGKRLHQRKQTNKRNWGLNTMLFSSLISQKFHLRECCWWKLLSQTSLTPMWDTAKAKGKKREAVYFQKVLNTSSLISAGEVLKSQKSVSFISFLYSLLIIYKKFIYISPDTAYLKLNYSYFDIHAYQKEKENQAWIRLFCIMSLKSPYSSFYSTIPERNNLHLRKTGERSGKSGVKGEDSHSDISTYVSFGIDPTRNYLLQQIAPPNICLGQ